MKTMGVNCLLLSKSVRDNTGQRESFMQLAVDVFGLSFHDWYTRGYWQDAYLPYTLFDHGKAVANVSVNRMETLVEGQPKHYIQLGTVMTAPAYRNCGLSRRLMEAVLSDWRTQCDGIYLYANNTVLDFYPKFGFFKAEEYSFSKAIAPSPTPFVRLDMDKEENVRLLYSYYEKGNPMNARPMLQNFGLLMFYCGGLLKDCVYYSAALDCIVVAEYEAQTMVCHEIFCNKKADTERILTAAARPETRHIEFGFTPKDSLSCEQRRIDPDDDQLFVWSGGENMFSSGSMRMPSLSHA